MQYRPNHGPLKLLDTGKVLRAAGLSKHFAGSIALRDVTFEIAKPEKVYIVGPSGSGKTTLLRCLNLLIEPDSGSLEFGGDPIAEWDHGRRRVHVDISHYRSRLGMVFQHFELFPHLTVLGNITLGPRHVLKVPRASAEERGIWGCSGLPGGANVLPVTTSQAQATADLERLDRTVPGPAHLLARRRLGAAGHHRRRRLVAPRPGRPHHELGGAGSWSHFRRGSEPATAPARRRHR